MARFILRRLLLVVPVLLGLITLTFVMIWLIPADPAAVLAGENANQKQIEEIRKSYGLDRPVYVQFISYVKQVARGDFGTSIYSNRPVLDDIRQRLPATLELTIFSLIITTIGGIGLGTLAAVWRNSFADHVIRIFSVGGLAVASFWLAIMLQLTFSMDLGWLPLRGRLPPGMAAPATITGSYLIDSLLTGNFQTFSAAFSHLMLPAITLSIGGLATVARFTRSSIIENINADFAVYAQAMGYPRWRVVFPYVLRNSLTASVNQIGLLFGSLIAGSVVVEAIYDWPGLGSYLVEAIFTSDFKVILAVTLVVGVFYALVNIAVDVVQALIDPRVREQMK
jgi:peptide/nickel transport system permease protein